MGVLDVEKLLAPFSPEQPCGDDLEYDDEFGEMERAAQAVAEQQYGETVIEGAEADWKEVHRRALSLLERTKDLRVAAMLARSAIRTSGLPEFCETVSLILGLVDRFWEDVHPRLDPEDDNDPTLRVNTLATLFDEQACLRPLGEATLLEFEAVGRFSYRDHLIASGEMEPRSDESSVETSMINAILENVDLADLQERADLLQQSVEDVESLESSLTERVGVGNAASFEPLAIQLRKMHRVLAEQLEQRGVAEAQEQAASGEADEANGETKPAAFDEIRSREDVNRLLDKICDYYRKNEPASPVPLLLERAKRVAGLGFMELLRELAPGGVSEAEAVTGVPEETDGDY
jgi:type VI secretion system protein ImpA